MEVQINSMPVKFEIEDEKSVADVVDSMLRWTAERDLVFLEVYINGEVYPLDGLPSIPLRDIKTMDCIVESKADIIFSSSSEASRYCMKAAEFLVRCLEEESVDMEEIQHLAGGIEWIISVLNSVLNLLEMDADEIRYRDRILPQYVDDLLDLRNRLLAVDDEGTVEFDRDDAENLLRFREVVRMVLLSDEMKEMVLKSIDSPDVIIQSIEKSAQEIGDVLKNIEETAIAFQSGNDAEGSEKLKSFVEFMLNYNRTCAQIIPVFGISPDEIMVEGVNLEEKNTIIQDLLNDIIGVMENDDIISLSDILEYELLPQMENLSEYLGALKERIEGK